MIAITPKRILAVALAVLIACSVSTRPAIAASTVTPADQVQFDQQKAMAHLRELEERMYRLSETIRELEPDESARLILGVQKSREELIVAQMSDAIALLDQGHLNRAGDEQAQIISKLQALRDLLLATDLDLSIKLDRLHRLQKAIRQLDQVVKEEDRLHRVAKAMDEQAKKDPASLAKKALEQSQQDQALNRQGAQSVKQLAAGLAPPVAAAAAALERASQNMGGAEGKLGQSKPGEAAGEQSKAQDELAKAHQALDDEMQKVLKELREQLAKEVVARLTDMLERQTAVRLATEKLSPKAFAADRQAVIGVRRLSAPEQQLVELADQTVSLIEETGFSVALPPALRSIQADMIVVAADLKEARADAGVIGREKNIEAGLAELIEAMKPLTQTKTSDEESKCKGCNCDKNKLLAEMRILRLLEARVAHQTIDLDAQRQKVEAVLGPEMRDKIYSVRDQQGVIRDAISKLRGG